MFTQTNSTEFQLRLKSLVNGALERRGLSARAASMAVVGHDGLVRDIRAGRIPSADRVAALFEFLGLEFNFGPPRDVSYETEVDGACFATVPRYDAEASAGNGFINVDAEPIDHLAFSKQWLERSRIDPGSCLLITASGTSMEPTISDGDLMMIDRRKTRPITGKVYVYNDPDDGTRVKRFEMVPGDTVIARSDNPKHDPKYYLGAEGDKVLASIIGEVIWTGHRWD